MNWNTQRMGKVTSSEASRLLASSKREMTEEEVKIHRKNNPKSKAKLIDDHSILSSGAITYCHEIISEITTGEKWPESSFKETDWGNEYEPEAFAKFAQTVKGELQYFGKENPQFFSLLEFEGFAGGSPDFTWNKVVGEIKCPYNSAVHVKRVINYSTALDLLDEEPEIYAQIQMNMMCTESESGIFVSYDPRQLMKPLFTLEVPADIEYQQLIRTKIAAAKKYVQQSIEKFR